MNALIGWLGDTYLWVKAAHAIITFFWIAGLFMLPRYLAYQAETRVGSAEDKQWSSRSAQLKRIILTPSLIVTWVLGLMIATSYGFAGAGWIHAKLLLALLLSGYHGWISGMARKMAAGARPMTSRQLRLWNEVPAAFTILMVGLAILKPF